MGGGTPCGTHRPGLPRHTLWAGEPWACLCLGEMVLMVYWGSAYFGPALIALEKLTAMSQGLWLKKAGKVVVPISSQPWTWTLQADHACIANQPHHLTSHQQTDKRSTHRKTPELWLCGDWETMCFILWAMAAPAHHGTSRDCNSHSWSSSFWHAWHGKCFKFGAFPPQLL